MPDAPVVPITPETLVLDPEWLKAAELAAHNLGFRAALANLSPERWQLVPCQRHRSYAVTGHLASGRLAARNGPAGGS
ncbi:hypothetical protein OCOJLMKI_3493 [Methylobacterium iners]|uniref:Uncharacterized protein n=1 Tax=Methylobacterium iners TaxID=418707 RepID=A0ABQ4S387_9HYPH|nr:hypothetical protein OCOJLMKI_3493 [Methylobacterium iners]